MIPLPDTDCVAAILREVGATVVLPHFRALDPTQIHEKDGPLDLVTVADVASEQALKARLTALLPGSLIVGEEEVSADPRLLDRIDGDVPVWIIDPIDGTYAFAHGDPAFGMIVSYAWKGRTLAGWIYDPCRDRIAVAVAGDGTVAEGKRVRLAPLPEDFSGASGVLSRRYCPEERAARLEERSAAFRSAPQSVCSAQEYFGILTGTMAFSYYNRALPWDHAAGALMVAEAGGKAAFIDGTPYRPSERRDGLLVAADEAGWERLRAFLFD
jgi:fructose-1,6-bisphosphatase/inositol monophosphatase family enzyme